MSKKTHDTYVKELATINPYIKVIGTYIGSLDRIDVECTLCGHRWRPVASWLVGNRPSFCPKCHCRTKANFSDALINTHPNFANMLFDKSLGERYSKGSIEKVDWICPNCGNIVKNIPINKVISRQHIPCKRCSDGISYPNKYMFSFLEQLNIQFVSEYMPEWIKPKRYDFYIPSKKIIIEMDGNIGHGNKTFDGRYPDETLEIDKYKDNTANHHGLDVIRINCIESDSDFIKSNIINSKLSTLFDLSNVDFLLCNKFACSSLKMKACNIWNKYHEMENILQEINLPRSTIIRYLKDCSKYGLCDYDPKAQMKRSGERNISKAYSANRKSVICLEFNKVFESCREAYKWLGYSIDGHSIQDNCNGITQSAGKHPSTKEKLHWMFYEDYIKMEGCV